MKNRIFLPIVSIIVPIYNSEFYLPHSLNDILNQTYENIEVICVNDGSTDNSAEVVKTFARTDKRILLVCQEHKGVSAARINGLKHAKGDYISFVDADDRIENNMIETFVYTIDRDIEIAVCNYYKEYNETTSIVINKQSIPKTITSKDEMAIYTFRREEYRGFTAWLWNKFLKRDLIERTGLSALEQGFRNGEDVAFFTDLFLNVDRIQYIDEPLYHYYIKGMTIEDRVTPNSLDLQFDALDAYEYAIKKMEKYGIGEDALAWVKRFYCYRATRIVKKLIEYEKMERYSEAMEASKKYLKEYEKTNMEYPERIREVRDIIGVDYDKK